MRRSKLFAAIAMLLGVFVPLAAAEIALQIIGVYGGLEETRVNKGNPIRKYVPNQEYYYTYGRFFELSNSGTVNNYGFVNDQTYDPDASLPLLAVIGDSYVEAVMVPYAETIHGRLAEELSGRARVYSFGMSSAALSDYLAYVEYVRDTFKPVALVIVIVGNDFDQSLTLYRDASGYHSYEVLPDGQLRHKLGESNPTRIERLVEKVIGKSALVRYVFVHLGALRIVQKLTSQNVDTIGNTQAAYDETRLQLSRHFVDFFLRELSPRANLRSENIALVVDAIRPELYCEECRNDVKDSFFGVMRSYLITQASHEGYVVVDMEPVFQQSHRRSARRFESDVDSHWNSLGHAEAAAAVLGTKMITRLFLEQAETP